MANPRSRSRGWALQVLYAWEQGPEADSLRDSADHTLSTRRVSPRYVPYLDRLIFKVVPDPGAQMAMMATGLTEAQLQDVVA